MKSVMTFSTLTKGLMEGKKHADAEVNTGYGLVSRREEEIESSHVDEIDLHEEMKERRKETMDGPRETRTDDEGPELTDDNEVPDLTDGDSNGDCKEEEEDSRSPQQFTDSAKKELVSRREHRQPEEWESVKGET